MADQGEYFWRGPVRTREYAIKMIKGVAITFLVIGGLVLLPSLARGFNVSTLFIAGLIGLPAAFLLKSKGLGAARTLMVVLGLFFAISAVSAVGMMFYEDGRYGFIGWPGAFFFGFLFLLTTRGSRAARYLRDAPSKDHQAEVFD